MSYPRRRDNHDIAHQQLMQKTRSGSRGRTRTVQSVREKNYNPYHYSYDLPVPRQPFKHPPSIPKPLPAGSKARTQSYNQQNNIPSQYQQQPNPQDQTPRPFRQLYSPGEDVYMARQRPASAAGSLAGYSQAGSVGLSEDNLMEHTRHMENQRSRNLNPYTKQDFISDRRFNPPTERFERHVPGKTQRAQSARPAARSEISQLSSQISNGVCGKNYGIMPPPSEYELLARSLDRPLSPPLSATDIAMGLKHAYARDIEGKGGGFKWEHDNWDAQSRFSISSSVGKDSVVSELRPGFSTAMNRSAGGGHYKHEIDYYKP